MRLYWFRERLGTLIVKAALSEERAWSILLQEENADYDYKPPSSEYSLFAVTEVTDAEGSVALIENLDPEVGILSVSVAFGSSVSGIIEE